MAPTPITILTGFLGSGKTTLILNLIPQLPPTYKLALLKNEFGDLAVDSQLASSKAISGVRELLNGCICCNLVGQLGEALDTLRTDVLPDRIIIETSGSAFPATLAMEVNRLARESHGEKFVLDGVVSVLDVENWKGYEDTSVTAKLQAQYTDLVVFNKWESVSERRFDECLDRLGDLELQTPWVKSDMGRVGKDVVLGIDGALARNLKVEATAGAHDHGHAYADNHQSEVEVLSITLDSLPANVKADADADAIAVDLDRLEAFLLRAPKDEIYRIKAVLYASSHPTSSTGQEALEAQTRPGQPLRYILNWAFGRWTFTPVSAVVEDHAASNGILTPPQSEIGGSAGRVEPALRMTIVLARDEANKWKKRIESGDLLALEGEQKKSALLRVDRIS